MPNSLFAARRHALSPKECPPRFETVNRGAREMLPESVAGIHLYNAKMQLYSDDYKRRNQRNGKRYLR